MLIKTAARHGMNTMGTNIEKELTKAYRILEEGKIAEARDVLSNAYDYTIAGPEDSSKTNSEITFAHWCCSYWADFVQNLPRLDAYEQGDGLMARWKAFKCDYEAKENHQQKVIYAIQQGIFTLALNAYNSARYESARGDDTTPQKSDLLRKKGLCLKKLGKYEEALNLLTEAYSISPQSSPILAEMADCFALCGEEKNAKVLFREAFFLDASRIEIEFLDSELICCLIRRVREKGYTGPELHEWIPVYGVVYGVFNVKRERLRKPKSPPRARPASIRCASPSRARAPATASWSSGKNPDVQGRSALRLYYKSFCPLGP